MRGCALFLVIWAVAIVGARGGKLKDGFYSESCPRAEALIADFVKEHIPHAPMLAPPLLRLHFHDCFVNGCDGSILINSTAGNRSEKEGDLNDSLRGFGFIDRVKALVEKECPGTVSCADIVALVARDAVGVIGGPHWNVPTGRRDGTVSTKAAADANIPSPFFDFKQLISLFERKGLELLDLVWLSGAHTIGVADCGSFGERLYNFDGKGHPDPSLDPLYAANLRKYKCKTPEDDTTIVEMDPGSFLTFDLSYYKLVLKRRGLFSSDASLLTNATAKAAVAGIVKSPPEVFFQVFARSVEKLGEVEVKTGTEGEIRKVCWKINGGGH